MVLALVESEDLTAYEVLAELERLFGPDYQPSPGAIYPALKALAAEGILVAYVDGRAKRYQLTAVGKQALAARQRQLAVIRVRTAVDVQADAVMKSALTRLDAAAHEATGRVDATVVGELIDAATRQITQLTKENERDSTT